MLMLSNCVLSNYTKFSFWFTSFGPLLSMLLLKLDFYDYLLMCYRMLFESTYAKKPIK